MTNAASPPGLREGWRFDTCWRISFRDAICTDTRSRVTRHTGCARCAGGTSGAWRIGVGTGQEVRRPATLAASTNCAMKTLASTARKLMGHAVSRVVPVRMCPHNTTVSTTDSASAQSH